MRTRPLSAGLAACLLLLLVRVSFSGEPKEPRAVILRGAGAFAPNDDVRTNTFHLFAAVLAGKGIVVSDSASWTVILEAIPAGGGEDSLIAVSLTYAMILPEEMIAFGRRSEIMYASMPPEKRAALPAGGKWVREMVSEEFARSYVNPVGGDMFVSPRRDLERRLGEAVERFRILQGKMR